MAHFPIMSIEQANPGLWRARQYGEIDRQNREAMFAPFTLAQELKKMQQFNKYYPEDMESTFRNRDASTAYTKTQNQWFGPTAQSNIDWIYKGQIPQAIAHTGQLNAQSLGQRLENNFFRNTFGGDNDSTINPSPNYSAPDNVRLTGNRYNPYPESYNPTTVENIPATGPTAPLNNADKQAMQQNKIQQQAFDYLTRNNVEATGANIDKAMKIVASQQLAPDTYAQAQQNNAPMQSANPASVTEYIKNLGGITGQQGGMSMAPQQRQPFVPSSQNLSSLRQGDQQVAQIPEQTPVQTTAQNSPMSLTDKMQKYADFQAMKKGQPLPSMEAENAAKKELAVEGVKEFIKTTKNYSEQGKSAAEALPKLQNLENALDKLPPALANSWVPEGIKKMTGNKEVQTAIKAGADLMMGELKPMFGGLGQIRVAELNMLANGTPGHGMTNSAAKEVIGQVRTALEIKEKQGIMSNKLRNIPGITSEDINAVIGYAIKNLTPIDNTGNHPERLKDWTKYATREAVQAAREGINYIPDGLNPNHLTPSAILQLKSEGRAI